MRENAELGQAAGARVGKMCGLGLNTLEYTGADLKYAGLVRRADFVRLRSAVITAVCQGCPLI